MRQHPLWPIFLGLAFGVLIGAHSEISKIVLMSLLLFGALPIGFCLRRYGGLYAAVAMVLGTLHAPTLPPLLPAQQVELQGMICRAPPPSLDSPRSWTSFDLAFGDAVYRVIPSAFDRDLVAQLQPGDLVSLRGSFHPFSPPEFPGEFDPRPTMAKLGIVGRIELSRGSLRLVQSGSSMLLRRLSHRLRASFLRRLQHQTSEENARIGAVLLLGLRHEMDYGQRDLFRRTGTYHLLAISGLHLGLILGGIRLALSLFLKGPCLALSLIAVATFYLALADFAPSLVRAWAMSAIYASADFTRRPLRGREAIPAAALLVLVLSPEQINTIGFQFSLLAVFGIVFLSGPIQQVLVRQEPITPLPRKTRLGSIKTAVVKSLAVSTAATLATAPLSLWAFGQYVPWAPLVSLALLPWLSGILLTLFASLFVSLPLFDLILDAHRLWVLEWLALVDHLPATPLHEPKPSGLSLLLFSSATILLSWKRPRVALTIAVLGGLITLLIETPPTSSRIHLLAFDSSDYVVIQTAHGHTLLAGRSDRQGLPRELVRTLRALGIRKIDGLLVPRWNSQELGWLPPLCERFPIRKVFGPERVQEMSARLSTWRIRNRLLLRHPLSPKPALVEVSLYDRGNAAAFEVALGPDESLLLLGSLSGPSWHRWLTRNRPPPANMVLTFTSRSASRALPVIQDQTSDVTWFSREKDGWSRFGSTTCVPYQLLESPFP